MGRNKFKNDKIGKLTSFFVEQGVKCSCSHRVFIPPNVDRIICTWCKHWVYRTKELEKEYKKKEFLNKLQMEIKKKG